MKTNIFLDYYNDDPLFREEVDYLIKVLRHRSSSFKDRSFNEYLSDIYLDILCVKDADRNITVNFLKKYVDIILKQGKYDLSFVHPAMLKSFVFALAINRAVRKYFPSGDIPDTAIRSLLDAFTMVCFEYSGRRQFLTTDIISLFHLTPETIKEYSMSQCDNSMVPHMIYVVLYNVFKENNIETDDFLALLELNNIVYPHLDYTQYSEYYKPD